MSVNVSVEIELDQVGSKSLDRIVQSNLSLLQRSAQLSLDRICDDLRGDCTIESDAVGANLGFDLYDLTVELFFHLFGVGLNGSYFFGSSRISLIECSDLVSIGDDCEFPWEEVIPGKAIGYGYNSSGFADFGDSLIQNYFHFG